MTREEDLEEGQILCARLDSLLRFRRGLEDGWEGDVLMQFGSYRMDLHSGVQTVRVELLVTVHKEEKYIRGRLNDLEIIPKDYP